MVKTEKMTFIRVNPVEGVNATTKVPFSFANIVLSDGLESVELPLDFDLVQQVKQYTKGDKVQVDIQFTKQGYNFKVLISKVHKVA